MRYKMIFVMLNEQLNDLYRNNLGNLREMYSVLAAKKYSIMLVLCLSIVGKNVI